MLAFVCEMEVKAPEEKGVGRRMVSGGEHG
jgi:hypothetical protein